MSNTRYITRTAVFCALGALLPQVFHVFGAAAGQTFLPMHIPAMLAGLILGPVSGVICGAVSPLLSFFVTGGAMPILIKVPFMMAEIAAYGFFCGLFSKKVFSKFIIPDIILNVAGVFAAQIAGRAVSAVSVLFAVHVMGITHKAVSLTAVITSIFTGVPGIVIQLVFVPLLAVLVKKALVSGSHLNTGK